MFQETLILTQIIFIDIILAADNAIIIGLIASNFGNEPCAYVVNFKNAEFLKDVNNSIMVMKKNL